MRSAGFFGGATTHRTLVWSVAIWATACSVAAPPTLGPGPEASRVASSAVETLAAPPAEPEEVLVPGAEGLALHGTWRTAGGTSEPAVLLLHMYAGRRQDWDPVAEALQQAGIASLAIDLRGQGDTGGSEDWALAIADVAAAQAWLADQPNVDPGRRGTVGASIGANLALAHAASDDSLRAVALLSPGLDYFQVSIEGLMSPYGARPILLVASEKDGYSADAVRTLADEAKGQAELVVYPGGAHGTQMFFTQSSLLDTLIAFLQSNLSG